MPGYEVVVPSGSKDRLLCPECKLILRDPVQTVEGVRLCKTCYDSIARLPDYTNPDTGVNVQDEHGNLSPCFADKAAGKEVLQLDVQCSNKDYGCTWTGKLADFINSHENGCKFKPQPCPNSCGELVLKDRLQHHLEFTCGKRMVECKHCGQSMRADELENHHSRQCDKYPVKCELCGVDVPRNSIEEHKLRECQYMQCTCGESVTREGDASDPKSVAGHLADPAVILLHLLSIFNFGSQLFDSINSAEQRIKALEDGSQSAELGKQSQALSELQKTTDKRFIEIVKQIEQIKSQKHHTSNNDKNLTSRIKEVQDTVLRLEDKNTKQQVQIQSLQTQLQHQFMSKSAAAWDVTSSLKQRPSAETERLDDLEKRYENIERQVTMLKVHVSEMELQLQASLASTYDGSFMWRIPDLKRRRRDAIDGRITSLYSPPFYTAKNGYKMCIRVYLNGDGMGHKTHLSLFFVLMKGEFDALLKWPFDNKVSLILVDQNHRKHIVQTFKPTPESSSFQRPISDMNVASGCPQFCKLSFLDEESYAKDDVLFIKCIVDTSHIFHP